MNIIKTFLCTRAATATRQTPILYITSLKLIHYIWFYSKENMDSGLEDDSVDYDYIDQDGNPTNNADIYVSCATYKGKLDVFLLFLNT